MQPMLRSTMPPFPNASEPSGGIPLAVWRLRRNCALTPRQSGLALFALAATSIAVASLAGIATHSWLFLPFALAEALALGTAYFHYARHALDGETVTLFADALVLDIDDGAKHSQWRARPQWVRIVREPADAGKSTVFVCYRHDRIEIGRHVPPSTRTLTGTQLRDELATLRMT